MNRNNTYRNNADRNTTHESTIAVDTITERLMDGTECTYRLKVVEEFLLDLASTGGKLPIGDTTLCAHEDGSFNRQCGQYDEPLSTMDGFAYYLMQRIEESQVPQQSLVRKVSMRAFVTGVALLYTVASATPAYGLSATSMSILDRMRVRHGLPSISALQSADARTEEQALSRYEKVTTNGRQTYFGAVLFENASGKEIVQRLAAGYSKLGDNQYATIDTRIDVSSEEDGVPRVAARTEKQSLRMAALLAKRGVRDVWRTMRETESTIPESEVVSASTSSDLNALYLAVKKSLETGGISPDDKPLLWAEDSASVIAQPSDSPANIPIQEAVATSKPTYEEVEEKQLIAQWEARDWAQNFKGWGEDLMNTPVEESQLYVDRSSDQPEIKKIPTSDPSDNTKSSSDTNDHHRTALPEVMHTSLHPALQSEPVDIRMISTGREELDLYSFDTIRQVQSIAKADGTTYEDVIRNLSGNLMAAADSDSTMVRIAESQARQSSIDAQTMDDVFATSECSEELSQQMYGDY